MTQPRRILAGQTYAISRRCSGRRFLLEPTPQLNDGFAYVLGEASVRFNIELHAFVFMSNHFHLVCTDMDGRLPDFMQVLVRNLTRVVQACCPQLEGDVFDKRSYCATALLTQAAVAEQLAYVLANPVTAGLAQRHHRWRGLVTKQSELDGASRAVQRPSNMLRTLPRASTLRVIAWRPPGARSDARASAAVLDQARRRLRDREQEMATDDRAHGPTTTQRAKPTQRAKRSVMTPTLAANDVSVLKRAKLALRLWRQAYREARRQLLDKLEAVFPHGTWMMRHLCRVQAPALPSADPVATYLL